MSLLPLNEESIFENVPLVVLKMKSDSMKVVNMYFLQFLSSETSNIEIHFSKLQI